MPSTVVRLAWLAILASAAWLVGPVQAENWPQWRGARLDGVSGEKNLPAEWGPDKNIAWRCPLPGPAGATPVVWDDQVYLTSVDGDDLVLLCIGPNGQPKWKEVVGQGGKNKYRDDEGNNASPSPSTDGKHVWCFFANGLLACYTVEGRQVWKFNVEERYGKLKIAFGLSSTPVLDGDRLYLQLIHGEGNPKTREARVVCLDKATGQEIWQVERPSDGRDECEHSYASPVMYRDAEREFLLTHGCDYLVAHDLKDGREIFRCGDLNPKSNYNATLRFVASPLAVPGLIVVPSAKGGPVFALKPGFAGDLTENAAAFHWKMARGTPDVPSPLYYDGLVYLCRENGNLVCLDAKTGEQLYEKRTVADRHRASPVYADGKIYCVGRKGTCSVVKAGPEFEMLAQNAMGEDEAASLAISNGTIYLRTFAALYAIRQK